MIFFKKVELYTGHDELKMWTLVWMSYTKLLIYMAATEIHDYGNKEQRDGLVVYN